jgi:hypothetical protein
MRAPALDRAEIARQQAAAKKELLVCKTRCRENFDVSAWAPMMTIFGCWNYGYHHQNLVRVQERLRELDRLEAALPPSLEAP